MPLPSGAAGPAGVSLTTGALVFVLDRATKAAAFRRLGPGEARSLGPFSLRPRLHPRPHAWAGGSRIAWLAAYAAALGASIACVRLGVVATPLGYAGLGAALGGALGNLHDRLRHGAVLDFVELRRWWSFNAADVALLAGLGAVAWASGAARLAASLALLAPALLALLLLHRARKRGAVARPPSPGQGA